MANVGLLYNLGKYDPPEEGEPPDAHAELDGESTINAVADALRWGGHEVIFIEADEDAYDKLRSSNIDIAFNMSEGIKGESRESHMPAICEMLGIPYTGSKVLSLAVCLDKPCAKKVLAYCGVPTPKFIQVKPGERADVRSLEFPLYVKPAHEGSSMGVMPSSLVHNLTELEYQVDYITRFYRQEALVEEFIDGREFTVGIVGNDPYHVFPIMEISFAHCPETHKNIYSRQYKAEWDDPSYYPCPADLDESEQQMLIDTAIRAYQCLGCLDMGRVDIRLRHGVPYVLEINPLPGLVPGFSDFPRVAQAEGMKFEELVNYILDTALERYQMAHLSNRVLRLKTAD